MNLLKFVSKCIYPSSKVSGQASLISMVSAACAAAMVHRNDFFRLYQKDKSSDVKVNFRQASSSCRRVPEAAELAYANKTKESIISQKLGSGTFGKLPIVFSTKVNLLCPLYSTARRCCLQRLKKQNCFAENFSKNSNLDDSGISLSVFPSRTNSKLHKNISVTPKMVKKVIMNLDLSKASGPDCIPVVILKNCEPELSYILAELQQVS